MLFFLSLVFQSVLWFWSSLFRWYVSWFVPESIVNRCLDFVILNLLRFRAKVVSTPAVPRASLPLFGGQVIIRGEEDYDLYSYQYASTSKKTEGEKGNHMQPLFIVIAKPDANPDRDVQLCLDYARRNRVALAVRTGGHQYTGASSTSGNNIQLDLSLAYPGFDANQATRTVITGVSHALGNFNQLLGANNLFVPHGQCFHVHAGGHLHTGGYSVISRAHGLFGDHIFKIRAITPDGKIRYLSRDAKAGTEEAELFYGILGGCPGSFAIVTHITMRVYHDSDYPDSRGVRITVPYHKDIFKKLLDIKVEMTRPNFPADYDFCITVLSYQNLLSPAMYGQDSWMNAFHNKNYSGKIIHEVLLRTPIIVLFCNWSNLGGASQNYDPTFFNRIKAAASYKLFNLFELSIVDVNDNVHNPMSVLTSKWVFPVAREYNCPYVKRCYVNTTSTEYLIQNKWAQVTADRVDDIQSGWFNGCKLSIQIQHFGGDHSEYRKKGGDGKTAYSWRQTAQIGFVADVFYELPGLRDYLLGQKEPQQTAHDWATKNDRLFIGGPKGGPGGVFTQDQPALKWLWGSWSTTGSILNDEYAHYYETKEKYERLLQIKKRVDPNGVLTPNAFNLPVEGVPYPPPGGENLFNTEALPFDFSLTKPIKTVTSFLFWLAPFVIQAAESFAESIVDTERFYASAFIGARRQKLGEMALGPGAPPRVPPVPQLIKVQMQ